MTRDKLSGVYIITNTVSGWLGKHHSEESKRKMSEARKGMTWSDARRKACDKARSRDGS